jgi:hypothetical protein
MKLSKVPVTGAINSFLVLSHGIICCAPLIMPLVPYQQMTCDLAFVVAVMYEPKTNILTSLMKLSKVPVTGAINSFLVLSHGIICCAPLIMSLVPYQQMTCDLAFVVAVMYET